MAWIVASPANFGHPAGRRACPEAAVHAARGSFGCRIARRGLLTYELALYQRRRRDGQGRVVTNDDRGVHA